MNREEEIKKAREMMKQRIDNRDRLGGASARPNILDFNKIGGYKKELIFKLKEDINLIDILPYRIKTNNHPDGLKPGDTDYVLPVKVHKNVGVKEGTYVCLKEMYGLECPICEEREERKKDPTEDEQEIKKLYPQSRMLYNVLDLDADGEPRIQILDMVYKDFEKPLRQVAAIQGEVVIFSDPEIGKTLRIIGENDPFPGSGGKMIPYIKPARIDFIDRDPYPTDIADKTYSLDEMLIVPTPEEIRNIYYHTNIPEEFNEDKKETSSAEVKTEQPVSSNPFANRGRTRPSGDAEPPSNTSERAEQAAQRTRVRTRPGEQKEQCPLGLRFGVDTGQKAECNKCEKPVWDACCAEADRLEAQNA